MISKVQRQLTIKEIIKKEKISSQDELLDKLLKKGFEITQATLSRDLRQIKAARVPGDNGGFVYVVSNEFIDKTNDESHAVTVLGFRSIEFSGNIGVIKTLPAYSHTIADLIDRNDIPEIVGTVAGNDTVMAILREGVRHSDVIESMKKKIPELRDKL